MPEKGGEPGDIETERAALALFEAALELPSPERHAWVEAQTKRRLRLRRRVLDMLRADTLISLKTGAASDSLEIDEEPERIGAYRIAGLIGRGGMGAVWRGERDTGDFSHTVAIKVIKSGLTSPSLIERFRRERQTLAALSHPNIARLYDGGETADGAPYIVMEFVDGQPLMAWVAEHAPDRSTRLDMFVDVCRAVAFAHSHLIVHRDLTPSNILITRDGTVRVIDFGIARLADVGDDAGAPGSVATAQLSLTPGYAAPERLTSSEVSTAADIYSLGRLLETLLETPDRELKAIIDKASQADPADRYPTVDAMLADIAAYRSGHAVGAYRPRRGAGGYAFAKFVRRHWLAATAASVAIVAVVGGLGLTLLANHRAELARDEAERRFEDTRAIANTLLFDVYDEVSKVPGATKARELLARTGVAYLEKLADDPSAPVDARLEAGRGFSRLAEVVGGQSATLGRYKDATALLQKSEAVLKAVYQEHPDDEAARAAYAGLLVEQAHNNLYNESDPEKARAQAIEAQPMLIAHAADDPVVANNYMLALQNEGDSWAWVDDYAKALAIHLRADRFYRGLKPQMQRDLRVLAARSSNLRLMGEAYHNLGKADLARTTLAQNVAIDRERYRRDPNNPRVKRGLIVALRYSGIVHRTMKRDREAAAAIGEAWKMAEDWRRVDPDDMGVLELVAAVGEVDAQILTDIGRYDEAEQRGDQVLAVQRRRVELSGGAPFALRSLGTSSATRGGNFYNAGKYAKACKAWRLSWDSFMTLKARGELSKFDEEESLPELRTFLSKACNPPRAGLGGKV